MTYEWITVGDTATVDILHDEGVALEVTVTRRWTYDDRGHSVARYVVSIGKGIPGEVWQGRAAARERAIEWAEDRGIVVQGGER